MIDILPRKEKELVRPIRPICLYQIVGDRLEAQFGDVTGCGINLGVDNAVIKNVVLEMTLA